MAAMPSDPPDPFGARSGARTTQRRGRMSPARHAALIELADRWLVDPAHTVGPAGPAAAFPDGGPLLVDVGGGTGAATTAWATDNPDHAVLAVELHRPGIAVLLQALEAEGPANVRVLEADITRLADRWPDASLAGIRILFPDPWPKRRHRHRRLVDASFVATLARLLQPGGVLHLATDWPDYADQMRTALAAEDRLRPMVDGHRPADPAVDGPEPPEVERWTSHRPPRPVTPYEQRGIDAGRPIEDLLAIRRSRPS